jgi:[ribosomal protein S18]-alanine N-acetyltransferase
MTCRLEPIFSTAASQLSALHGVCFPEDPWDVTAIVKIMNIQGFFGQMAWGKKILAGFALALDLGNECEILSLCVVPEQRRSGTGGALLYSICLLARQRGAERITLEVAEDNAAARALYAKRGFIIVGRRRNYYCEARGAVDALILSRPLLTVARAT